MNNCTKKDLKALGVLPSKHRGQNFLVDKSIIREILDFSGFQSTDSVVEVGPGLGALTYELSLRFKDLTLVEVEHEFSKKLSADLKVSVIEKDIREVNLKDYFHHKVQVISNVPYSISTDFSFWLFRESKLITSASLLLQREFAERLASNGDSRAYGSLSVLRSIYASAELGKVVPPTAFYPEPQVDSQLIKLDFSTPEIVLGDLPREKFELFVKACFSQKRKTLANSLTQLFKGKASATAFIVENDLATNIRAEQLRPKEILLLAKSYWTSHLD